MITGTNVVRGQNAEKKLQEKGYPIKFIQMDAASEKDNQQLVQFVAKEYGTIDFYSQMQGF